MAKFRKKPVVIEAVQYTGENTDEILFFSGTACNWSEGDRQKGESSKILSIDTLEGTMKVSEGDWIIKGVNGEFYPCKPDIFEKTYDCEEPLCADSSMMDPLFSCNTRAPESEAALIV